jgi:flagellin
MATSFEKLSSGLRINRASDDAAGLAISEKMRAQIRGLNQAQRNAQDAISFIQTAEGGGSSIHDMLQRGRELAVQAANDTLTDTDRLEINKEIEQLKSQIDTVANNTEFNTIKMLNSGSLEHGDLIPQIKDKLSGWIDDSLTNIADNLGLSPSFTNKTMTVQFYEDPSGSAAASMGTSDGGNTLNLRLNLSKISQVYDSADDGWGQVDALIAHEVTHGLTFTELDSSLSGGVPTWFMEGIATAIQGGVPFMDSNLASYSDAEITSSWNGDYGSAYAAVMTLHETTTGGLQAIIDELETGVTLDQALANTTQADTAEITGVTDFTSVSDFESWFNTSTDVDNYLNASADFSGVGPIAPTQGDTRSVADFSGVISNNTTEENPNIFNYSFIDSGNSGDKSFTFQIGANAGQSITMDAVDITSGGLGIVGIDVSGREGAEEAITLFDKAIEEVSSRRSTFGALQNRLEHTINNLSNAAENLTAAESRIRDVDMAKEMMKQTKESILSQAAQAMIAKANQNPQQILQLLR